MAQNTAGIGAGEAERKGRVKVVVNVRTGPRSNVR